MLQEAARDRFPFGGFPWARLAFSQANSPLRWFAALGGAPLVTFVVALGGAGLGLAVRRVGPRSWPWRAVLGGLAPAVLVVALGALLAWPLQPPPDRDGRTTTVALIQGNVPDVGLDFEDRPRQVLENHVAQTMKLAAQIKAGTVATPSLIVWPENSSDIDPLSDRTAYEQIDETVRAVGIPDPGRGDPARSGTDPSPQRRHPLVADDRPRQRVHQASSGAVR